MARKRLIQNDKQKAQLKGLRSNLTPNNGMM